MIKTSISLTTAAVFGLGLWLIIPQSVKWLAELFQLLLLCHLCFLMGLESGRYQYDSELLRIHCSIVTSALCGDSPKEWIYFQNKPMCTAFVKRDDDN